MALPDMPVVATYFDGLTAARRVVDVTIGPDQRSLRFAGQVWPLDRLRRVAGSDPAEMVLTLHAAGGIAGEAPQDAARLVLTDAALMAWITDHAPDLARRDLHPGTRGRVLMRITLAAAALGLILFVFLPRISDALADQLPLEQEVAFGRAVVGQIESLLGDDSPLTCDAPAGRAALQRLKDRLTEGQGLRYDIDLAVFDHEMINAFAAPGGQIVIMRGLLDAAESPEEVAGVLAHEIGHVEARDPTRLAFRSAGSAGIIALLLGDVTGGTVIGLLGDHILTASYTREAETAADGFAFALLDRTGIGTEGLARFFDRIEGMGGDIPEILSTHPSSGNRAEAARAAAAADGDPVLTAAEWRDLRGICG